MERVQTLRSSIVLRSVVMACNVHCADKPRYVHAATKLRECALRITLSELGGLLLPAITNPIAMEEIRIRRLWHAGTPKCCLSGCLIEFSHILRSRQLCFLHSKQRWPCKVGCKPSLYVHWIIIIGCTFLWRAVPPLL